MAKRRFIREKTRKISMLYCLAVHHLGNDLQLRISLNISVLPSAMLRTSFVVFVEKLIF